jgi:hypothetical protein
MKNIFTGLILVTIISLFNCCGIEPKPEIVELKYKNIIILSDLSSRLKNRPPKDVSVINKIIEDFKNECVKPGEKIGDNSCILFAPFSNNDFISVDVSAYKNIIDKQNFVNSTGKFKNCGLHKKLKILKNTIDSIYKKKEDNGLDLISLLIDKIENKSILKKDTTLIVGIDSTKVKFDNHIYIFTDGYLEYVSKHKNTQFLFGEKQIKKLREYCIKNNIDITTALQQNPSLGLPPYKNIKFKNITLHIMETHERGINKHTQTFEQNLELRDNLILEEIWKKWALESGFKKLYWNTY